MDEKDQAVDNVKEISASTEPTKEVVNDAITNKNSVAEGADVKFNDDVDDGVKPLKIKPHVESKLLRANVVFNETFEAERAEELTNTLREALDLLDRAGSKPINGLQLGQRFTTTADADFEKIAKLYTKSDWCQLGSMGSSISISRVIISRLTSVNVDESEGDRLITHQLDNELRTYNVEHDSRLNAEDIRSLINTYENTTLMNFNAKSDLKYKQGVLQMQGNPLGLKPLSEFDTNTYSSKIKLNTILKALSYGVVFYDGLKNVVVKDGQVEFEFDNKRMKPVLRLFQKDDSRELLTYTVSTNQFVLNGYGLNEIMNEND